MKSNSEYLQILGLIKSGTINIKQEKLANSPQLFEDYYNDKINYNHSALTILNNTLAILFPFAFSIPNQSDLELISALDQTLQALGSASDGSNDTSSRYLDNISNLKQQLLLDAEAIFYGDPAAKAFEEVIICYPGFYAIAAYRIAHLIHNLKFELLSRAISELAHRQTGIDIHPAAKIGKGFCIDHGTGIVIGETTEIGDMVKLYHGVTLGGLSVKKEFATKKRHPTIENNVIIYSNAVILGGQTVIGSDSIIAGNVWLTHSVEANSIVELEELQLKIRPRSKH